jgi:predicted phage terminase large subunit-like protein
LLPTEFLTSKESISAALAQIRSERAQRERERVERDADEIRARCQTLIGFTRESWHVLEPKAIFVPGFQIEAICDHLEAITRGEINRFLANVPPGSMKSLLVSVIWQAWEWGPKGLQSHRFLSTSYNDGPVKRDTRKTRDLILSDWFRLLWPAVELVRHGETSFANSQTGTREGTAFGSLTSQRGDRLTIDDPHSTETAESDADRATTTRKFREGATDRLNDPIRSAIAIIMQRLHMDDISGVIEQLGMDFVKLVIPMEFEPARRCITPYFKDPRTYEGQLMCPERWPRAEVERLKKEKGEYAYAGQYQQRPAPREGGLFKPDLIRKIAADPGGGKVVRGWDLAGTKRKTSAYTVGLKLRRVDGRFIIVDVKRIRGNPAEVKKLVKRCAIDDRLLCLQSLPKEPGQAGIAQKDDIADMLAGHNFRFSPETGDKEFRAIPVAASIAAEVVDMVEAPWNSELIDELRNFPTGTFKDQVDAFSRAHMELVNKADEGPGGMPESSTTDTRGKPIEDDPWAIPTDAAQAS